MQLRPDVARMLRERPATRVWLTASTSAEVDSFDGLARLEGLTPLGPGWVEVAVDRARRFLTELLHRDLAYRSELMPRSTAAWLADEFLSAFGPETPRIATNSDGLPHELPFSWTPATPYTFDAGVAVLGRASGGIYWVADED